MQACRAALQAPVGVGLGRHFGAGRAPACSAPTSMRPRLVVAPGANLPGQQRTTGQRPRQLSVVAAAKAGGGGGGNNGGGKGGPEPQPVLRWLVQALGVPSADVAAFEAKAPTLLQRKLGVLQANLAALQSMLPPPLAQQIVRKQPTLLTMSSDTVEAALAWLLHQFGDDAERLHPVLQRGPHLLLVPAASMQRRADYLQQQLGWQPGDGRLAAFIEGYPQSFATIAFDAPEAQAKLLLLTGVMGLDLADCLNKWSAYLKYSLARIAARYVLVQEHAPWLLYEPKSGGRKWLSGVINAPTQLVKSGSATKEAIKQFERTWPESKEGLRLLEALRSGSIGGWPLPPTWKQAEARRP